MFHSKSPKGLSAFERFNLPRKLDLALKKDDVDAFREYAAKFYANEVPPDELDPDHELILRHFNEEEINTSLTSSAGVAKVLLMTLKRTVQYPKDLAADRPAEFRTILGRIRDNLKLQYRYNSSISCQSLRTTFDESIAKLDTLASDPPVELKRLLDAFTFWSTLVERLPTGFIRSGQRSYEQTKSLVDIIVSRKFNVVEIPGLHLILTWSRNTCLLEMNGCRYLLPGLSIQEIHNKISDMLSVTVFSLFSQGSYLPETATDTTLEFITLLCKCHAYRPNPFFNLAGDLEALVIGEIISKSEEWENNAFKETIVKDLKEEYKENMTVWTPDEDRILEILEEAPVPFTAELGCLTKITGHPISGIEGGIEKLHGRTNRPRTVNVGAVAYTVQSLKKDYLEQYHQYYQGSYPPVTLDEGCHPKIVHCIRSGKSFNDPSLTGMGVIQNSDWSRVHIEQHQELDWLDNMLPYLKDKAMSVSRSRVYEKYIKQTKIHDKHDQREMNALLFYVMHPEDEVDHVPHCKEFADARFDIEDFMDLLAIRLVPKEKELKPKFRFFGCQTYMSRCRNQVILQYAKKYLERYSSDQALVLTEIQLMRKLAVFSKTRNAGGGMTPLTISVDVQAWNNNFTTDTVEPPMREVLDRILGNCLFSRAHSAFERSILYTQTRTNTYFYEGQLGGIEGLMQEVWMIVYIHQIKYALRNCTYRFDIQCKGDDVRIKFFIPDPEVEARGMPAIAAELKEMLRVGLLEFGHPVKLQESYFSTSFMAFSKKMYVYGVALTSSFRQIQKSYGANNAFFPFLDDYISSAFSNAHSASSYGINHLAPYAVALFWTHVYLAQHPAYRRKTDTELLALTLIPNMLGGLPIIYLHNVFVRSESDLLSAACGLALWCRTAYPEVYKIMKKFIEFPQARDLPWVMLFDNPYALPVKKPKQPRTVLKQLLKKALRRRAGNESVRDLFMAYDEEFVESFVNTVLSSRYYDAKLVSSIYAATPISIIDQFMSCFANSKTMVNFLLRMKTRTGQLKHACNRMVTLDEQMHEWRGKALQGRHMGTVEIDVDKYTCPTVLAEDLREKGWERKINGITHPPIQHQLILKHELDSTPGDWDNHFLYKIHPAVQVHKSLPTPHFSKHVEDPFLGHTTPSGHEGAPTTVDSKNIITRNIKALLALMTTVHLESLEDQPPHTFTFMEIIIKTLRFYTPIPEDILAPFQARRRKGTRDHHQAARKYNLSIIPNSVKNQMALAECVIDTYSHFRVTDLNYRINFLHIMCHSVALILMDWSFPKTRHNVGQFWGSIFNCTQCHTPIKEPNSYFKNRDYLRFQFDKSIILQAEINQANALIRNHLEETTQKQEFRIIPNIQDPSIEEARQVVAEELARITITNRRSLAFLYQIHAPTPQNLADMAKLKTGRENTRTITGADIARLPGSSLANALIPHVLEFTYRSFDMDNQVGISLLYSGYNGLMLPWAPYILQLKKAMKLSRVLIHIADLLRLPSASVFQALLTVSNACTFIGTTLASYPHQETPEHLKILRIGSHTPTSIIRGRLKGTLISLGHIITRRHPLKSLLQEGDDGLVIADDANQEALVNIMALIIRPIISHKDLKDLLSSGRQKIAVPVFAEVTDEWDPPNIENILRETKWKRNLMTTWRRGMSASLEDVITALEPAREAAVNLDPDHFRPVAVEFHDLPSCYLTVRAEGLQGDMDDIENSSFQDPERLKTAMADIQPKDNMPSGLENCLKCPPHEIEEREDCPHEATEGKHIPTLDLTHLTRSFGLGVTSARKLYSLLKNTWLWNNRKSIRGNFVCLADGEGGDSRFLADSFPQVLVHWNSLVDPDSGAPAAAYIRDAPDGQPITHPRIRFFTQKNIGGDLTKPLAVNAMITRATHAHLVKCDADLPMTAARQDTAKKIWCSALKIWTEIGTQNSILIIKVFLDLPQTVASLLSLVSFNAQEAAIVTLRESHIGYEAYIVAAGPVIVTKIPPTFPQARKTALTPVTRCADYVKKLLKAHDQKDLTERDTCPIDRIKTSELPGMHPKYLGHLDNDGIPTTRRETCEDIAQEYQVRAEGMLNMSCTNWAEHEESHEQLATLTHKLQNLSSSLIKHMVAWTLTSVRPRLGTKFRVTKALKDVKREAEKECREWLSQDQVLLRFPELRDVDPLDMEHYNRKIPFKPRTGLVLGTKIGMEIIAGMASK